MRERACAICTFRSRRVTSGDKSCWSCWSTWLVPFLFPFIYPSPSLSSDYPSQSWPLDTPWSSFRIPLILISTSSQSSYSSAFPSRCHYLVSLWYHLVSWFVYFPNSLVVIMFRPWSPGTNMIAFRTVFIWCSSGRGSWIWFAVWLRRCWAFW